MFASLNSHLARYCYFSSGEMGSMQADGFLCVLQPVNTGGRVGTHPEPTLYLDRNRNVCMPKNCDLRTPKHLDTSECLKVLNHSCLIPRVHELWLFSTSAKGGTFSWL